MLVKKSLLNPWRVSHPAKVVARCAAVILCLLFFVSSSAPASTWITGDGEWKERGNWEWWDYPDAGDDVYIVDTIFHSGPKNVIYINPNYDPLLNSLHINTHSSAEGTTVLYQSEYKLTVINEYIGSDYDPAGRGAVVQMGGQHRISENQYLGYRKGNTGQYHLSGSGALNTRGTTYIGYEGNGEFEQHGGAHTTDYLKLGNASTGTGTYKLYNGSLVVGDETVGVDGSGDFYQYGGIHEVKNYLTIGARHSSFSLKGGSLLVGRDVVVRNGGFVQTGGSSHHIKGCLYLGDATGVVHAFYQIFDGELSVDGIEWIGYQGIGEFWHSGGIHRARDIALGIGGSGRYYLFDGSLLVETQLAISSQSSFSQSGGSNHVGLFLNITGEYSLQGGSLSTPNITIFNGGKFSFTGGRLSVDNFKGDLVNKGGILAPGESPGATYIHGDYTHMLNAILEIELGGLEQGVTHDFLNVTESLFLEGGGLEILLYEDFKASAGDFFDILDWGEIVGTFAFVDLPGLDDGLSWDISQLYIDGSICVNGPIPPGPVPAPASVLLLGSGLLSLLRLRRKF